METKEQLASYIREVADLMGLLDWQFEIPEHGPTITTTEPDQVVAASCSPLYGRRRARIMFPDDWATSTPENLRYIVVHELLHCHFVQVQWTTNNIASCLTEREWSIFMGQFRDAMEHHIDAVSTAWAPMLPLPR